MRWIHFGYKYAHSLQLRLNECEDSSTVLESKMISRIHESHAHMCTVFSSKVDASNGTGANCSNVKTVNEIIQKQRCHAVAPKESWWPITWLRCKDIHKTQLEIHPLEKPPMTSKRLRSRHPRKWFFFSYFTAQTHFLKSNRKNEIYLKEENKLETNWNDVQQVYQTTLILCTALILKCLDQ